MFTLALCYYTALSAKTWTWVFVSQDSGDWLASSIMWIVPHAYGSPLYISLGHLVNLVFPVNLAFSMTFWLSVIPGAITAGLVYLIIKQLKMSNIYASLGVGVVLACGIFLSQATVLEEYSLTTMFVTLAFLMYLKGNRQLTAMGLGLSLAVHIIALPIAVLWGAVNIREWRTWVKPAVLFTVCGILPYGLILYLMAIDTPKFMAGYLSLEGINAYLGGTGVVGTLSLVETPQRLLEVVSMLLLGFGVTLVPLWYGLKQKERHTQMMALTFGFCLWMYLTSFDLTTWTYVSIATPLAAVAVVIGLTKMPKIPVWCIATIIMWIVVIIPLNAFTLNADILTRADPKATSYYKALHEIPDGSIICASQGGSYGFGVMYAIAEGRDFTQILLLQEEGWNNQIYKDYLKQVSNHKALAGNNWVEQVESSLNKGKQVFITYQVLPPSWQETVDSYFTTKEFNDYFKRVVSKE